MIFVGTSGHARARFSFRFRFARVFTRSNEFTYLRRRLHSDIRRIYLSYFGIRRVYFGRIHASTCARVFEIWDVISGIPYIRFAGNRRRGIYVDLCATGREKSARTRPFICPLARDGRVKVERERETETRESVSPSRRIDMPLSIEAPVSRRDLSVW